MWTAALFSVNEVIDFKTPGWEWFQFEYDGKTLYNAVNITDDKDFILQNDIRKELCCLPVGSEFTIFHDTENKRGYNFKIKLRYGLPTVVKVGNCNGSDDDDVAEEYYCLNHQMTYCDRVIPKLQLPTIII